MTTRSLNEKIILMSLIIIAGCGQDNELVVADGSTFEDGSVVDEDGSIVDEDGSVVDEDGSVVDEDGSVVDEDGSVVDEDGSVVDEDGSVVDEDSGMTGEDSGTATMIDVDEDGVTVEDGDCDDNDAERYPDAEELCDGKDNNCNGETDDEVVIYIYSDEDDDGHAGLSSGREIDCLDKTEDDYLEATDCDDTDSTSYVGATELCDGKDNDCDESTDEDLLIYVYADTDGDGHAGASSLSEIDCLDKTEDDYLEATDCDDGDVNSYPGATEVCDGKDNDCDESTDEELEVDVYTDGDGDGYAADGASLLGTISCSATPSAGQSTLLGDCDDSNSGTYPGAPELCDSVDNDCNSTVDDNIVNAISLEAGDGPF